MASWLVCSFPEQVVWVQALGTIIVLCFGQATLLSQCLSPPSSINLTNCREVSWVDYYPIQGE